MLGVRWGLVSWEAICYSVSRPLVPKLRLGMPLLAKLHFVTSNPPTGDDFRSQRVERPTTIFPPGISECSARDISVHTERNDSE